MVKILNICCFFTLYLVICAFSKTSSTKNFKASISAGPGTTHILMEDEPNLISTNSFNTSLYRTKRGIIWNKFKKIKKGIWSVKRKMWRIKTNAVEIIKGKDHSTARPHYETTAGTWGFFKKQQQPKRSEPLLSGIHGPPYAESNSNVVLASESETGWQNKLFRNGSSTNLSYADLVAIYNLPINMNAVLNKIRENQGRK